MDGPRTMRRIDGGLADGRRQIAFGAALAELHESGASPDTLRFFRFRPTVLIGRHQALGAEVRLARCREEGVGLARRVTGGGAVYVDEGQLCWEIVADRSTLAMAGPGEATRAVCSAIASGLTEHLGVEASFRPQGEIVVGGRKLGGTAGLVTGDTLVLQGTLLIETDAARMARLINMPRPNAGHHANPGPPRIVTLDECVGHAPSVFSVERAVIAGLSTRLGVRFQPGEPTLEEAARAERLLAEEIGTDAFVLGSEPARSEDVLEGSSAGEGGRVTASLRLEGGPHARRIREIVLSGDFVLVPPQVVYDLEAGLRGVRTDAVAGAIEALLAAASITTMSVPPSRIREAVLAAIAGDRG